MYLVRKMTRVFGKNTHYYINNLLLVGDFDCPPEKMPKKAFLTYNKRFLAIRFILFSIELFNMLDVKEREGLHNVEHKVIVIAMFVIVK